MKIKSERKLSELVEVLYKTASLDGDPTIYWVFENITDSKWENMTVIAPIMMGSEFPKTYGHYHNTNTLETYKHVNGEGVLILQKKLRENIVEHVYIVKPTPGEEITITPEWGHSWSNVGKTPLITFDDWRAGHTPADYQPIKELGGMAVYLVKEDGELKIIQNPKYKILNAPQVVSALEFKQKVQL